MCFLGKILPPSIPLHLESGTLIYRKSLEGSKEVKSSDRLGLNPEPQSSQQSTLLLSYVSSLNCSFIIHFPIIYLLDIYYKHINILVV